MADFDISAYVGASDTATVNNALLAAAAAGGGRVHGFNPLVPLNIDTSIANGGIRMQVNTHLDLGMGGVLKAIPTSEPVGAVIRAGIGAQSTAEKRMWMRMKITGGIIEGDRYGHLGTDGEQQMGIWSCNCDGLTIEGVEVRYFWGDGIYLDQNDVSYQSLGGNDYRPRNVLIRNNRIRHNRRNGISVICAEGYIITENHIWGMDGTGPYAGIDIEPDHEGSDAEYGIIDRNIIHDCKGPGIELADTSDGRIDKVIVGSNQIWNCGTTNGQGIKAVGLRGDVYTFLGNQVTGCKGDAMLLAGVPGWPVKGAIVSANHLSHSTQATVAYGGGTLRGAGLRLEGGVDAIASQANAWIGNGCGDFSWDGVIAPDPNEQHVKFGSNVGLGNAADVR